MNNKIKYIFLIILFISCNNKTYKCKLTEVGNNDKTIWTSSQIQLNKTEAIQVINKVPIEILLSGKSVIITYQTYRGMPVEYKMDGKLKKDGTFVSDTSISSYEIKISCTTNCETYKKLIFNSRLCVGPDKLCKNTSDELKLIGIMKCRCFSSFFDFYRYKDPLYTLLTRKFY